MILFLFKSVHVLILISFLLFEKLQDATAACDGCHYNQSVISLYFCFMQRETESDYLWALKEMNSCFDNWIQDDITIVTDRELALMGAVSIALPNAVLLLCMWHIEKKVLAKFRSKFEVRDD